MSFVQQPHSPQVPLEDESVDVAVFCLSLMGTNIRDFLEEANRVLKPGWVLPRHRCMTVCTFECQCTHPELSVLLRGLLKVAEVSSRFEDVRTFLGAVTKLGFKVISKVRAPGSLSSFCHMCSPSGL